MSSTAEVLAQRQLDAYNGHDLEAFVACYAPGVEVRTFPGAGPPDFAGHEALRARYGPMFEQGDPRRAPQANRDREHLH